MRKVRFTRVNDIYMDNRAVIKCQEYERQLRHDLESQKW